MTDTSKYTGMSMEEALSSMHFEALRPGQKAIIDSVLDGKDTLAIMPTGGGKSATYIVPTLMQGKRNVILSPLIALQADQQSKLQALGFEAAYINSTMSKQQKNDVIASWVMGDLQFLFTTPERLLDEVFAESLDVAPPDILTIDEIHCASKWGITFRPAYGRIGETISRLRQRNRLTVLGLTATLTSDDEQQVREMANLQEATKFVYYQRRDNLSFRTVSNDDPGTIADVTEREMLRGPVIVYSPTVAYIEKVLAAQLRVCTNGSLSVYHGQMESVQRTIAQEAFMTGKSQVMLATCAFGMGIDKADIRAIVHAGLPKSVESYVQEAGRAGRDGKPSTCHLVAAPRSVSVQQHLLTLSNPTRRLFQDVWRVLKRNWEQHGSERIVSKTIEQIANEADLHANVVRSVMSIFNVSHVVSRCTKNYVHRVQLTKKVDYSSMSDSRMANVLEQLHMLADDYGLIEMSPEDMKDSVIGIKSIKQLNYFLVNLSKGGYLQFSPAAAGKDTIILTDSFEPYIDWDMLRRKYELEVSGLNDMISFAKVNDEDKHQAAEDYFSSGRIDYNNYRKCEATRYLRTIDTEF